MTKQMIESMKKSGEDAGCLNMLKRPELLNPRLYVKNPTEALTNFLATLGDYLRLEDMFTNDKAKKNKKELKKILETS
jgi:hypothetical protein